MVEHVIEAHGVGGSNPSWSTKFNASVAQLNRVSGYEPDGRGFESLSGYQFKRRLLCECINYTGE